MREITAHINGKGILEQSDPIALGTDLALGPLQRSPPIFASFSAWARSRVSTLQARPPPDPITIPWLAKLPSMTGGPLGLEPHTAVTDLCLGRATEKFHAPSSSPVNNTPTLTNSAHLTEPRKPSPNSAQSTPLPLVQAQITPTASPGEADMAYQRANLGPFKPQGFHVEEVPNRPMMARVVARRRPRPRNEDMRIVTITPLPGNAFHFPAVEEIIREFLEDHRRTRIKDVQPCHLGQAFVRFEFEHDRDRFVLESPHPYGDVNISL